MPSNIGHAASDVTTPIAPLEFDRQPVDPEDVRIDIKFCGVIFNSLNF
jgi:uncharacterized zinc-type alcohol dehydrogenase-like protein